MFIMYSSVHSCLGKEYPASPINYDVGGVVLRLPGRGVVLLILDLPSEDIDRHHHGMKMVDVY